MDNQIISFIRIIPFSSANLIKYIYQNIEWFSRIQSSNNQSYLCCYVTMQKSTLAVIAFPSIIKGYLFMLIYLDFNSFEFFSIYLHKFNKKMVFKKYSFVFFHSVTINYFRAQVFKFPGKSGQSPSITDFNLVLSVMEFSFAMGFCCWWHH